MGISAFRTIQKVLEPTYLLGVDILTTIDFTVNDPQDQTGTPKNTMREIQVQFYTDLTGILSVSFDDSNLFVPVNNNGGIDGLATFTIFVDNSVKLNFRFSSNASIGLWIGG